MRRTIGAAGLVLVLAGAAPASATPSRWAQVRDPELFHAEQVGAEVERDIHRTTLPQSAVEDALTPRTAYATRARMRLLEAGAQRSRHPRLRLLLARVEQLGHRFTEAALMFESVLREPDLPAATRADIAADVAIVYARLKRIPEEIEAEELAIGLDPLVPNRALTLANQAEAFMGRGDVTRAIAGYRAALDGLGTYEMAQVGPTTLFSLGVALDRSGDLEGGMDAVARARSYDPRDQFLQKDSWFFSTAHDEAWYEALGHWLVARRGDGDEVRLGAYESSVVAWRSYLARAPASDPYVAVARARLKLCEREFAALSKKLQTPTPLSGPAAPRTGARD